MKTTAECWKTLILDGEKLVFCSSSGDVYIAQWDKDKGMAVDEDGQELPDVTFRWPADWHIYKEPEQEWPDGTPGWFWDSKKGFKTFGWFGRSTKPEYPYRRYPTSACEHIAYDSYYKHFEPITEAILPAMIKHDGGEHPGNVDDSVFVTFRDGKGCAGRVGGYRWNHNGNAGDIIGYRVIKRTDK